MLREAWAGGRRHNVHPIEVYFPVSVGIGCLAIAGHRSPSGLHGEGGVDLSGP